MYVKVAYDNFIINEDMMMMTPYYYDLDTLAENAHYHLFCHSRRQAHCLNHLYTVKPRPPGAMQLRTRGHQFELPAVKYEFNKQNVIVRSLFNYV